MSVYTRPARHPAYTFVDVQDGVIKTLTGQFGLEGAHAATTFDETDFDSLDVAEFVIEMEELFGLVLEDDEADRIARAQNVHDIAAVLHGALSVVYVKETPVVTPLPMKTELDHVVEAAKSFYRTGDLKALSKIIELRREKEARPRPVEAPGEMPL